MVSIVITAYNVGEWIEQSVFSALGQTHKNIEVIVIDDCSTDNTASVLEKIKDCRLKVIHNKKNRGAGLSRRAGIKAAKGDYILLRIDDPQSRIGPTLTNQGRIRTGHHAAIGIDHAEGALRNFFQLEHDALKNTVGHRSASSLKLHKYAFHKITRLVYTLFAHFASTF